MRTKLYIVGAGSVGGHIAWNINSYGNHYEISGFFDDAPEKIGKEIFGHKVLGPVSDLLNISDAAVVFGIAFPKIKRQIVEKLSANDTLIFPPLVHEKAWVSKNVSIGNGSVIYPGTSINYGSLIGDFVVLNMNCALGHHTKVGDYSSFAPGVNTGGHTSIGEAVDMGIGSSTIQNIKIGDRSIVGGQSMVVQDIKSDKTVMGIPAKSK